MCMIGSQLRDSFAISYKQCDLAKHTQFYEPIILNGLDGIRYLKFGREGNTGSWCGVNNYGVSVVAADAYLEDSVCVKDNAASTIGIFDAYSKIVSDYKDAKSAAEFMREFYQAFLQPDILLISDAKASYYIEALNGEVIVIEKQYTPHARDNYFCVTNHFRLLHGSVGYANNQSTYLRLQRGELLAAQDTSVFEMLVDQYYGKSVMSICRDKTITPSGEEPFFTQASAVFATNGQQVNCAYLINGNPCSKPYVLVRDIFGAYQINNYSSVEELSSLVAKYA